MKLSKLNLCAAALIIAGGVIPASGATIGYIQNFDGVGAPNTLASVGWSSTGASNQILSGFFSSSAPNFAFLGPSGTITTPLFTGATGSSFSSISSGAGLDFLSSDPFTITNLNTAGQSLSAQVNPLTGTVVVTAGANVQTFVGAIAPSLLTVFSGTNPNYNTYTLTNNYNGVGVLTSLTFVAPTFSQVVPYVGTNVLDFLGTTFISNGTNGSFAVDNFATSGVTAGAGATPEPSTLLTLGGGLVLLVGSALRRSRRA